MSEKDGDDIGTGSICINRRYIGKYRDVLGNIFIMESDSSVTMMMLDHV